MFKTLQTFFTIILAGCTFFSVSHASELGDGDAEFKRISVQRSLEVDSDYEEGPVTAKKARTTGDVSLKHLLRPEIHFSILNAFLDEFDSLSFKEIYAAITKSGVVITENNLYDYLRRHKVKGWIQKESDKSNYMITEEGMRVRPQLEQMLPEDDDQDLLSATSSSEYNPEHVVGGKKRTVHEEEQEEIDDSSNKPSENQAVQPVVKKTKIKLKIIPLIEPQGAVSEVPAKKIVNLEQLPAPLSRLLIEEIKAKFLPVFLLDQRLLDELNTTMEKNLQAQLIEKYGVSLNQMVADLIKNKIRLTISDQ